MDFMDDIKDLYILGEPIATEYGILRPVKVKEYSEFLRYYPLLNNNELKMKDLMFSVKLNETHNKEVLKDFRDEIRSSTFVELVHQNLLGFRDLYLEMFNFLFVEFDDKQLYRLMETDDIWKKNRRKILRFNGIVAEDVSSNPKIQYFNELKKEYNRAKGNATTFESIYTSILVETGLSDERINNLTLYKFYSIFHRIGSIINYKTSIQFKTVDYENKIKVEPWSKTRDYDNHSKKRSIDLDDIKGTEKDIT